ncbi:MAG TPA: anti-sigma factor [Candidatus Limnocylindria bacterium]
MSMNRHEPFEELISASLHGDLTAEERQRLDRHLDSCADCRATLAAFSDQRRIVAGLRHVAPPRDLDARVRAGIERGGRLGVPWWRRPQVALAGFGGGLALVAGALFALVVLNGSPDGPSVGQASPTASVADLPSATAVPTLPPPPSSEAPSAAPSASAAPSEPAEPASPEPQVFLALTGPVDNAALTVRDGSTGDTLGEVADTPSGEPIAAELSPDGQWLAYITTVGESGLNEVRATRLAEGAGSDDPDASPPIDSPIEVGGTVVLGRSVAGSPFLERLSWSPNSEYLAYTLIDPDGSGSDAWTFQPELGEPARLTDVGDAYAGSWTFDESHVWLLWVSRAGETPRSYLVPPNSRGGSPIDPSESAWPSAENVFQPLVSPNGALVIFWSGRMDRVGEEWLFVEGGAPWLAQNTSDGALGFEFTNARELFSDVSVGRDAFTTAAITWGGDSDAYAVWDAIWTGRPQGTDPTYPDPARVYFGHAADPRGLTAAHAIDEADLPDDAFVVDVKVSPTGRHLVITAARPRAGVLDPPKADLLLVTRNYGTVADEVEIMGSADDGWFGPAAFDRPR